MQKINILMVDDDELFRSALEYAIQQEPDMQVMASATDGNETLQLLQEHTPDIILLDIQMPDLNGMDTIREIRKRGLDIPILILTTFNESDFIADGLAHGANGYFLKRLPMKRLFQSVRDVLQNELVLPAEVAVKLSQFAIQQRKPTLYIPVDSFQPRERDILHHMHLRLSVQEIAEQMDISIGTLRNYLTAIYQKLEVKNHAEAMRIIATWTGQKSSATM